MKQFVETAANARAADSAAIHVLGIPSLLLMEHAASALAASIIKQNENSFPITVLCGPGNNGADGLALARILYLQGWPVKCLLLNGTRLSTEEEIQLNAAANIGVPIRYVDTEQIGRHLFHGSALIVDALFGSGLSRNVEGGYALLIHAANESGIPIVSVDIPSGLNGDTGQIMGCAIQAEEVLALDCAKLGMFIQDGPSLYKTFQILDIGIPDDVHSSDKERIQLIDEEWAASLLPARSRLSHKGSFGKVLMVGGSLPMQGALAMAASACFHTGAGTVTVYTPEPAAAALAAKMDLAMVLSAPCAGGFFASEAADRLQELGKNYTCLAIGSGMGKGQGSLSVARAASWIPVPAVIDADCLNLAAMDEQIIERVEPTIITPHLSEFSRLSRIPIEEIKKDMIGCARAYLKERPWLTLVLKSDKTLIMDQTRTALMVRPDSRLAKGGSGDVLCGILCGLLAQNMDPFEAAVLGVYLHNKAADNPAFSPFSFTPLDLIASLNSVFLSLQEVSDNKQKTR